MQKFSFLAIASFSLLASCASAESFMPDNDLWMQDAFFMEQRTAVNQDIFNQIIQAGLSAYNPIAKANKEGLQINALWADSTVNANCSRYGGKVTINAYGGLARRPEVNPSAFALVLCHELSHAYGGAPYIRPASQMSAEGQSDYMATKECYQKVFALVPELQRMEDVYSDFIESTCQGDLRCKNSLVGSYGLGSLLSVLSKEKTPRYETPDPTVVSVTELSYPATTQCRLDSYLAGTMQWSRPRCWFAK